jgi:hypothetical protein
MPDKRAPGSGNSPLQESSGTPASATRRSPLSSSLDRAVAPALQVVPHALCRQYPIINNLPRTDESPVIIDVMNTFGSSDTSRAGERVLFDLARQAPAWRKVELMEEMYRTVCDYVDAEAIPDAVRRRQSFNLIHLATMFKVDVFVMKHRPFDEAQFERRERHPIALDPERQAYIASAEDNILAKLEWYRMGGETSDRQWIDVQNVIKTQRGRLQWAAVLAVADPVERALKEASSE